MAGPDLLSIEGQQEFDAVSRSAFWHELAAVLTGRERSLLPLEDVVQAAHRTGQIEAGVQDIPLSKIKGSEGRTRDFDASFLPLKRHLRDRWIRVYMLMEMGREMPPIDVYQIGDVYFVKDGHHRVSIARRFGWTTIRAHVIEVKTRAPLDADVDPESLLKVAEYADFLERTGLDHSRPQARLDCSHLGRYDVIYDHILGHCYFLGLERGHEVPVSEAAASWYDTVYRPVMDVVERYGLTDRLDGWTEADIYLALTGLWLDLSERDGRGGPEEAVQALVARAGTGRKRSRSVRGLKLPGRLPFDRALRAGGARRRRLLAAVRSGRGRIAATRKV